jgi:uncharacterized membrane protein
MGFLYVSTTDTALLPSVTSLPELEVRAIPRVAPRLASVDVLRGLAMVVMALDHARFYFSSADSRPEYMAVSTPALFFARWITHYAAPTFFFLAGAGAFLSTAMGNRSVSQVSRFLWTRGIWLLVLCFTVVGFASTGLFPEGYGDVIWCLGLSMLVLALMVRLPLGVIGAISVLIICAHDLLDPIRPMMFGKFAVIWSMLHSPGVYPTGAHSEFYTLFCLIPWVAIMTGGYAFGPILLRADRRKVILWTGAAITAAFFVLRGLNLYSNGYVAPNGMSAYAAGPWHVQPTVAMTICSFFNTLKHPASLQFLLMTLGPMLLVLAWLDDVKPDSLLMRPFLVFGRVPLLAYVLHLFLLRTMAVWVSWAQHQDAAWLQYGGPLLILPPNGYGHSLPFIYLMWFTALVAMYFPCKWFMELKRKRPEWWWLRYL